MEADLQRYYQLDLLDLWRGTLTLRKLGVLVARLPSESATMRELSGIGRDHPLAGWSLGEVLTARALDELAVFRWQWESVHREKGRPREAPASALPELPRLRTPPEEVRIVSPHDLGGFVNGEELT